MDGGAWWVTVHGVAKSKKRLNSLSHTHTLSLSLWKVRHQKAVESEEVLGALATSSFSSSFLPVIAGF